MELHQVDPGEQVHIGQVVGAAEGEEGAEPLLGQDGSLGRELAAQDCQVVEGLCVQLIVYDGEESLDH